MPGAHSQLGPELARNLALPSQTHRAYAVRCSFLRRMVFRLVFYTVRISHTLTGFLRYSISGEVDGT